MGIDVSYVVVRVGSHGGQTGGLTWGHDGCCCCWITAVIVCEITDAIAFTTVSSIKLKARATTLSLPGPRSPEPSTPCISSTILDATPPNLSRIIRLVTSSIESAISLSGSAHVVFMAARRRVRVNCALSVFRLGTVSTPHMLMADIKVNSVSDFRFFVQMSANIS